MKRLEVSDAVRPL